MHRLLSLKVDVRVAAHGLLERRVHVGIVLQEETCERN